MNETDERETTQKTEKSGPVQEAPGEAGDVAGHKSEERAPDPGHRRLLVILAVLAIIGAATLIYFLARGGEQGGKVVPAPRSAAIDPAGSENASDAGGEQIITLDPEQIRRGGIKIETVGETLSSEAASVAATGVVQANAYAETPVISLVGGVIRSVTAQLGEDVSRGETLAVLVSDELASAQSRYLALQTEARTARQNYQRAEKLVQISPVSRGELDQAQARLKTDEAQLDEMRSRFNRTAKLVEIGAASREEFEQDRTKLKTAEAQLEQSRKQFQRASEVARLSPVSRAEFEQAAVRLRTAESELAAARQRLLVLGLPPARVGRLRSPSQITSELSVPSPVSGTVTARSVNPGEVVEANKELMRITNLSTVWVIAQVYERDLGRISLGSGASVTTDAYPGRLFRGQVTYIDPNISPETRTAQVRVELANPGQVLKIGMYVNVAFGALGTAEKTAPVIPAVAVQNINNRPSVFVATHDPQVFILRTVRLGAERDGQYVVLEGLNVGDKIVTEGSFLLRAELLKQHSSGQ